MITDMGNLHVGGATMVIDVVRNIKSVSSIDSEHDRYMLASPLCAFGLSDVIGVI